MPKLIRNNKEEFILGIKGLENFYLYRNRDRLSGWTSKTYPVMFEGEVVDVGITKPQVKQLIKWLQESIGE